MSDGPNPRQHDDGPPPPHPARVYVWLALMIALGVAAWALFHLFPEAPLSGDDTARALYLMVLVAVLVRSFIFGRQVKLSEVARNIAIWAGIFAVLGIAYTYKDRFGEFGAVSFSELVPSEPSQADERTFMLTETENGDYMATGEVEGTRARFLIDTGASDIVLSPADAARAGIDIAALDYATQTNTANGTGRSAGYTLTSLDIGPVHLTGVQILINQAPMDSSLLGMSFLRRMKSFAFRDRKLYLRWR